MKIFLPILFFLLSFSHAFSQELLPEKTAEDYRQMSKSQRIGGIILLAAGVTTLAIASQGDISFDDLPTVLILGGLATVGGTTLLITSGKNDKKSRALTANLGFKKPIFEEMVASKPKPIPTVSLRVKF
jgi:hypothetical protein